MSAGFVTFTTTGYGDYSPTTAAGRSVFVFWALLGLATMTVLVSGLSCLSWGYGRLSDDDTDIVLQDAFSSRYKSALYSGAFESAVMKYRREAKKVRDGDKESDAPLKIRPSTVQESSARAQQNLESLPGKVLTEAKVFHKYIQYLLQTEPGGAVNTDLRSILDDISKTQKLDERMKDEILQDEEAKHVSTSHHFLTHVTKPISRHSVFSISRVSSAIRPRSLDF